MIRFATSKRTSLAMRAVDIVRKKRDGGELSAAEIDFMVQGIGQGVADYQWSALLMATLWRGMNASETAALTRSMIQSGSMVDLARIGGRKVDKHSTGGVGDKTSMIVAPIVAATGVPVPMVSGRGLGHTGGTLDKLESIPGFRVDLNLEEYVEVLGECGLVMIGQTEEIAPADKYLYAMRDATATVESIPLISASIMSKKLSEGIDGLVLDVKFGNGAFMERIEAARELAIAMCAIGRDLGKQVRALLTRMDQPLGRAVGNAVEIAECVECLQGQGPADLMELSIELAAEMVLMGNKAPSIEQARDHCRLVLDNGSALDRFRRLVIAQGGNPRALDDPSLLPQPKGSIEVDSRVAGYVQSLAARPIGHATMLLGAGRERVDSTIDPAVGVILHKKVGDRVEVGEPLCTVLVNDTSEYEPALEMIGAAYVIGVDPVTPEPLIVERI